MGTYKHSSEFNVGDEVCVQGETLCRRVERVFAAEDGDEYLYRVVWAVSQNGKEQERRKILREDCLVPAISTTFRRLFRTPSSTSQLLKQRLERLEKKHEFTTEKLLDLRSAQEVLGRRQNDLEDEVDKYKSAYIATTIISFVLILVGIVLY